MTAQHVLIWRDGKLHADPPQREIESARHADQSFIWLDLEGEPQHFHKLLADTFRLSRITLHTIEEDRERAKLVERRDYFALVVHGLVFDSATDEAETPKLDIVFAPGYVITVHRASLPWLEKLRDDVRSDTSDENIMARGMPYVLHAVLDALTDSYFPILDDIDDIVDQLENDTVTSTSNTVQQRIFRLKRALAQMRRVVSPQIEVTTALITRTGEVIPRESEAYFADIRDHLVRAFEVIDSYRDLMSGLLDVFLSTVSNRLNSVMKQLTIIATIFLPLTFITGIFGQNFGHSPQVDHDGGLNFWLVLAGMALITTGQLLYFKRKGWMGP